MFLFDAVTSYLLTLALVTLLVALLVRQSRPSQRTVVVWVALGAICVLLGCAGSYAAMRLAGYEVAKAPPPVGAEGSTEGMHGEMEHHGGMGKMSGAGVRGVGGRRPKLCLTTLVRKLDLLTGGLSITLSAEQAAAVNNCLKDIEKPDAISEKDAGAKRNQLAGLLNDNQKAQMNAIDLPPPEASSPGPDTAPGMPGGGGMAAPQQEQKQNPFQQDVEGKALKSLRERLASKGAAPKSETPKAPPAKAETPKASPPKPDASRRPAAKS